MASLPVRPGHESSGFVQPSTYLRRPRGHSQPMPHAEPLNAVDRDQKLGLVSLLAAVSCLVMCQVRMQSHLLPAWYRG